MSGRQCVKVELKNIVLVFISLLLSLPLSPPRCGVLLRPRSDHSLVVLPHLRSLLELPLSPTLQVVQEPPSSYPSHPRPPRADLAHDTSGRRHERLCC